MIHQNTVCTFMIPQNTVLSPESQEKVRAIAIFSPVAKKIKNLAARYLLSQILFWSQYGENGKPRAGIVRDGHRWIFKHLYQWAIDLELTLNQVTHAFKILKQLGLIITDRFRFAGNVTLAVRLNFPRWIQVFGRFLADKLVPPLTEDRNLEPAHNHDSGKNTESILENSQIPYTESTYIDSLDKLEPTTHEQPNHPTPDKAGKAICQGALTSPSKGEPVHRESGLEASGVDVVETIQNAVETHVEKTIAPQLQRLLDNIFSLLAPDKSGTFDKVEKLDRDSKLVASGALALDRKIDPPKKPEKHNPLGKTTRGGFILVPTKGRYAIVGRLVLKSIKLCIWLTQQAKQGTIEVGQDADGNYKLHMPSDPCNAYEFVWMDEFAADLHIPIGRILDSVKVDEGMSNGCLFPFSKEWYNEMVKDLWNYWTQVLEAQGANYLKAQFGNLLNLAINKWGWWDGEIVAL